MTNIIDCISVLSQNEIKTIISILSYDDVRLNVCMFCQLSFLNNRFIFEKQTSYCPFIG